MDGTTGGIIIIGAIIVSVFVQKRDERIKREQEEREEEQREAARRNREEQRELIFIKKKIKDLQPAVELAQNDFCSHFYRKIREYFDLDDYKHRTDYDVSGGEYYDFYLKNLEIDASLLKFSSNEVRKAKEELLRLEAFLASYKEEINTAKNSEGILHKFHLHCWELRERGVLRSFMD